MLKDMMSKQIKNRGKVKKNNFTKESKSLNRGDYNQDISTIKLLEN